MTRRRRSWLHYVEAVIFNTHYFNNRHPDKNTGDTKEEAEKMFQDISEAYEVLSSDDLRGKYDRGEAVFENQGGGGQQRHNPHQFFNQHFQQRGQQQQQRGGQRFHVKYG